MCSPIFLPSIGYRWTRRGISAAASTMDRVLARSASKALAAAEIVALEEENLGADLRALESCACRPYREPGATLAGLMLIIN